MKNIMTMLFAFVLVTSCRKSAIEVPVETPPEIIYTNLKDSAVAFHRFASFDLDGKGDKDILFSSQLVGDPIYQQDKMQWLVTSSFNANLPVNNEEEIPVLNVSDSIPLAGFSGFNWYNASSILLAQKIISFNVPPFWQGGWMNASHKFIPLQIKRNDGLHNAWVEVSFNAAAEKLVLHGAGVSKEANQTIQAGK